MGQVVQVEQLSKKYGDKQALQNISFFVEEGTCFGLLGPNGAGKSTAMKIISGILEADTGTVSIFGHDAKKYRDAIRKQIGYVPQDITLYDKISAWNNLVFLGEMYGISGKDLKYRINDVLKQVGLADRAQEPISSYSGGMKRRINIAAALLHQPKLVILDEPTVGIDPQSRNHIFEMIRSLRAEGVSIIYSTHYMEEVEELCDDIAIIDHGKVIVQGSLDHLLDQYAGSSVYVETEYLDQLPPLTGVTQVIHKGRGWLLETEHVLPTLKQAAQTFMEMDIPVKSLEIMRPSLEQVFLSLTGTSLRD